MSSTIVPTATADHGSASTFWFGDLPLRAKLIKGDPWLVLADICVALGIREDNALSGLDDDEKLYYSVGQPGNSDIAVHLVSEPGFYSLIMRSRKPVVKAFKRFVIHDVLPAIRKTGQYGKPQALSRRELAQMVIEAEDRAAAAELERDTAWQAVERNAPKVNYVERFVDPSAAAVHLGTLAAELGVPVSKLRVYLKARKLIFRDKSTDSWHYYSSKRGRAWFELKAHHEVAHRGPNGQVPTTLYVTPVGKEGIRRMLERDPIG